MTFEHLPVLDRLCTWLKRCQDLEHLADLNARLAVAAPSFEAVVAELQPPERQDRAALTFSAEFGRLKYKARLQGEAQAGGEELVVDGETEALRALFHRTRRSLLWRLANQNLFHALAEALFFELHESWPGGELNISNVKGEDGEGGKFELWLPAAASESADDVAAPASSPAAAASPASAPATATAADPAAPASPVGGGLCTGQCTFRVVTHDESGSELELARYGCVVVVDLDGEHYVQHVVQCSVPPPLLVPPPSAASAQLLSAARANGLRLQHLAAPEKCGVLFKRGHWMPVWRPRFFILHYGTLRYWQGTPPFHPIEWSEAELSASTSVDVIELADATLQVRTTSGAAVDAAPDVPSLPPAPTTLPETATSTAAGDGRGTTEEAAVAAPVGLEPVTVLGETGGAHFEMELVTPHATKFPRYLLRATSAAELSVWVEAIRRHIWSTTLLREMTEVPRPDPGRVSWDTG